MTHSPDAGDFSDLLALLAHEVQGPLAGMAGLAQSLTNRDLPPAAREEVESLARTSAALISTVETMITATRLGESAPSVQPFSPRLLVRDLAALHGPLAREKGLAFDAAVAPDLAERYLGDAAQIRQILGNLLCNAVKFTQRGGVRLEVVRDVGGLIARVSDTGPGIPASAEARIFVMYQRLDPGRPGLGLGLAVVRSLVRGMGGEVWMAPRPGGGSVFQVNLPLAEEPSCQETPPGSLRRADGAPLSILVADDSQTSRFLVEALLKPFRPELRLAADGAAALTSFASAPADVVLIDQNMPGMSGVAACRAMRDLETREGRRPARILSLSASTDAVSRRDILAAGADGWVEKPLNIETLIAAMRA